MTRSVLLEPSSRDIWEDGGVTASVPFGQISSCFLEFISFSLSEFSFLFPNFLSFHLQQNHMDRSNTRQVQVKPTRKFLLLSYNSFFFKFPFIDYSVGNKMHTSLVQLQVVSFQRANYSSLKIIRERWILYWKAAPAKGPRTTHTHTRAHKDQNKQEKREKKRWKKQNTRWARHFWKLRVRDIRWIHSALFFLIKSISNGTCSNERL